MKLNKITISLTDYVYSDKLESFFKELGVMEQVSSFTPDWKKSPIALGRRSEIEISKFNKLDFVSSGKIILNQYQNFSTVVAITIEIKLTQDILELLEENSDYKKNLSLFESYEKQLWEFWKTKISTTVLLKRASYLNPVSLIHLNFSTDNYSQFSLDVENAFNCQRTEPVTSLLSKFGGHPEGLISVLGMTDKTLSIACQNRAIFADDGFDFSGMMFFDVRADSWKDIVYPSYYKTLSFQQYRFWLKIRDEQVIIWKDKIEKLSKTIKKLEKSFSNLNETDNLSLFHEKSSFQIEYTSLMDEYRYLERIVGNQLTQEEDSWWGDHPITNEFLDLNNVKHGILKGIATEIIDSVEHLKGEFEIIKEQYTILGEELSDLMSFVNAQQNLKMAEKNEKIQTKISWQGWVMVAFTVIVAFMTWNMYEITSDQFEIENFDPEFSWNRANIVLLDDHALKQFEYHTPIHLSTMTSHNYKITIFPENDSIKINSNTECYFENTPTITMPEPVSFFIKSGGDEVDKEHSFRFNYNDRLPYFSPERMERTVFHSVGSMNFNVTAQDLQEPEKIRTFLVPTGLIMNMPSDFDRQTVPGCK